MARCSANGSNSGVLRRLDVTIITDAQAAQAFGTAVPASAIYIRVPHASARPGVDRGAPLTAMVDGAPRLVGVLAAQGSDPAGLPIALSEISHYIDFLHNS